MEDNSNHSGMPTNRDADKEARSKNAPPICVLATLPPPFTGMTLVTAAVVDAIKAREKVLVHNWSNGKITPKWRWRASKAIRSAGSVLYLIKWWKRPSQSLYTVANSGGGLCYNILVIAFARMLSYRCFLHHHVFAYLNRHDWRMSLITRLIGEDGLHVFLAPEMRCRFEATYGKRNNSFILSNVFMMQPVASRMRSLVSDSNNRPMRLGHMSNLTIEKGLEHVLSTFERLRTMNQEVRLVLAGPVAGKREKTLIDQAVIAHGKRVDYRGPVYGDNKTQFFEDIDVFLFPTEYKNEAQPLVIIEAFSFGRPVIAYGLACIPSLIGSAGGLVVPCEMNFETVASNQIRDWIQDPASYQQAVFSVHNHVARLRGDADQSIDRLIRLMSNCPKQVQVNPSGDSLQTVVSAKNVNAEELPR